jgi:hypothetical protein
VRYCGILEAARSLGHVPVNLRCSKSLTVPRIQQERETAINDKVSKPVNCWANFIRKCIVLPDVIAAKAAGAIFVIL